jgi:hypothetical protein
LNYVLTTAKVPHARIFLKTFAKVSPDKTLVKAHATALENEHTKD